MEIKDLLKECKNNRASAQKYLFDTFASNTFSLCRRYLKTDEDAEEMMFNGYLKIFKGANQFNYSSDAAVWAWIKKIMINECLMPYISFGIQNMRNIFTPSLAAGMEYYYTRNNNKERHFLLYADNYFFFNNNPNDGNKIRVNTFATFQLKNIFQQVNAGEIDPVKYNEQFSIGYLVNRNGTFFEKHSFRLGFPGFNYRNLQVLPGLFFNDFFRQVSPSVSLSVFFE